jgi:hypothetical protein
MRTAAAIGQHPTWRDALAEATSLLLAVPKDEKYLH